LPVAQFHRPALPALWPDAFSADIFPGKLACFPALASARAIAGNGSCYWFFDANDAAASHPIGREIATPKHRHRAVDPLCRSLDSALSKYISLATFAVKQQLTIVNI